MKAREHFDVVVAGGGTAGVAAAVAAARLGARVLLVERGEALGGNAAHALVHTFCGLFLPASHDAPKDEPVHAHPGFPRRFAAGLQAAGGAGAPERVGRVFVLPIRPDVLERYAMRECQRHPTLTCRLRADVRAAHLAVHTRDSHLLEIVCAEGPISVESRIVIDATGDAAVAALGGAEVAMAAAGELQCPSFIFRVTGVAPGSAAGFSRLKLTVAAAGAAKGGALPADCESILVRPGATPDEVYVTLNVARPPVWNPLDDALVAALESTARAAAERLLGYLRGTRTEFAQARIAGWPRRLGIRETRRLGGRAVVTADDVLAGRRREDEVAVSTWPIELWNDHRRVHLEHPAGPSSIPLGALVSRSPRLGTAGRCVSATHEALGALRVIGTAMATGEAIGVAAALAADGDAALEAIDPAAVRARIAMEAA